MITLRQLCLQRGSRMLLDHVNLTLHAHQKIGLIGANGTGKSSFFALLQSDIPSEDGDLDMPPGLRMGHLAQEIPALEQAAIEYVIDGDADLRHIEKQLAEVTDGDAIAELLGKMEEIDGYTATARAGQLLDGLGFTPEEQKKPVAGFSGGWRMRLNLARALMSRSDLLLLDEPTNHLDLDAIIWLEQFLKSYTGTMIIISHDRDFLDETTDHIIHLYNSQMKLYTGNYSAFETIRANQLALQQSMYEKQQRERAHIQSYIDRFKAKASKARQAQSRIKMLERMETISAAHVDSPFVFSFPEPGVCPNPLLQLQKISIAYGDHIILKDVHLTLAPGSRIGLLGPNGAGKSSLIKLLAGEISEKSGTREVHKNTRIGYFAQHQLDHLHLDKSPLQHLQLIDPKTKEQLLRNFLGGFGFLGDMVFQPVRPFSGGEKARLALALIVWQRPNLLLLDEPTNHLDLDMRQALTSALQDYQGALVVVSHDRHLVRSTTDSLMLVAHQKVADFDGDLDDYQKWLTQFRRTLPSSTAPTQTEKSAYQLNKEKRSQETRLKTLEKKMAELKIQLDTIEINLADPNLYNGSSTQAAHDLQAHKERITSQLTEIEMEWLEYVTV